MGYFKLITTYPIGIRLLTWAICSLLILKIGIRLKKKMKKNGSAETTKETQYNYYGKNKTITPRPALLAL